MVRDLLNFHEVNGSRMVSINGFGPLIVCWSRSTLYCIQLILVTLPKFDSSSLKSYRNPIGKDRLPTTMAFRGAVKLRGCRPLDCVAKIVVITFPTSYISGKRSTAMTQFGRFWSLFVSFDAEKHEFALKPEGGD